MPSQITLPDDTGDTHPDHRRPTQSADRPTRPTSGRPGGTPGIEPEARTGSRPEPDDRSDESARPLFALNLSLSQIVGGGLAAATAAALGSKLGLAGTIGGAAMASIVSAVAGSIYTASVRRTHRGVRTVLSRRAAIARPSGPARSDSSTPLDGPDVTLADPARPPAVSTRSADGPTSTRPARAKRRSSAARGIVIGALMVFAFATVVIFGAERFTGVALDGQHGGTTIGQVTHAGSESLRSARSPKSAAPGDASPAASSGDKPSTGASTDPSSAPTSQAATQPSGSSSDPSASTSQPTSGSTTGTSSGQSSSGQSTGGRRTAGSPRAASPRAGRAPAGSPRAASPPAGRASAGSPRPGRPAAARARRAPARAGPARRRTPARGTRTGVTQPVQLTVRRPDLDHG